MSNSNVSEIDKAIQAAKARKEAKSGTKGATVEGTKPAKAQGEPKAIAASNKPTDAEKAAKQAQRDAERAAKKLERDTAREAKAAEKAASQVAKVAHMSKVDKAKTRLPALSVAAQVAVDDVTSNFSAADVAAIAAWLGHFNRAQATARALTAKLAVGDHVRITGGDPRYVGMVGTVTKAQRIRCYVDVSGVAKPVYLFSSEVIAAEDDPTFAEPEAGASEEATQPAEALAS